METTTYVAVRTPSPTGLYWGSNGEVSCCRHAPYEGSDTWEQQAWCPLPIEDAKGYIALGQEAKCETCGLSARLILVVGGR